MWRYVCNSVILFFFVIYAADLVPWNIKALCDCWYLELSLQLEEEKNEVQRLENEKQEWLSRGVHAEFEKKDKVSTCVEYYNFFSLLWGNFKCLVRFIFVV